MFLYFLNNLYIFLLLPLMKRNHFILFLISLVTVSIILYLLPSTGADYVGYKYDYETSYIGQDFPYFFTNSALTAEPFYKYYSAFINIITGFNFNGYLSINFVIMYSLIYVTFRKFFTSYNTVIFLLFGLILVVPVLFYASPRSSVPFMLSTLALFLYAEDKYLKAVFVSFIAISFHSQFIPILLILNISYMFYKYFISKNNISTYWYSIFSIILSLVLFILSIYAGEIVIYLFDFISFLPSSALIEGKLHYLDNSKAGFRLTSLLSIVVFPITFLYLVKRNAFSKVLKQSISYDSQKRFIFLLGVLVFFSFIINILFIDNGHVSGRLARLSDYLFMMIGIGTVMKSFKSHTLTSAIILIVILCIAPIVYSTMYNFELSILF